MRLANYVPRIDVPNRRTTKTRITIYKKSWASIEFGLETTFLVSIRSSRTNEDSSMHLLQLDGYKARRSVLAKSRRR